MRGGMLACRRMRRLGFLVRSLDPGGAERQLVALVTGLDPAVFECTVYTFYAGGRLERDLATSPHVTLVPLGKRGRWDMAAFLARLVLDVRRRRLDLVHGYLGIANECALLAARAAGAACAWGLRSSFMDLSRYDWSHGATLRAGRVLSPAVDLVIYNSRAGQAFYRQHGYRPRREAVVPNGIDVARFAPDAEGRARQRASWHLGPATRVIGLVGRVDPMKDHPTFLRAMGRVADAVPNLAVICVGGGDDAYRARLAASPEARALGDRLRWIGHVDDVTTVYAALDLLVLSSLGEGFPNVVGEAMACGVPAIVTGVGDAADIVGDTGVVTGVGDPAAIADACLRLLAEPPELADARQRAAVQRIRERFATARLVVESAALFDQVIASRRAS